jgi:uncharacterized protein (TIGR01777 family)
MTTTLWTLIAIQIAMAAFDTIYHHELTERLAWRPSQRYELMLHAARSLVYAALFVVLGFLEVHGAFAMLVIVALAIEVVITLADFIEEDMSRKLPATERVNHTLLAINYGAILILVMPLLLRSAFDPTSIRLVSHGWWSALMMFAAVGAVIFGLRDLLASRRPAALVTPPEDLVTPLGARQTVLVTGATGFVGRRLVQALVTAGHQVIVLARDPARAATLDPPFRLITGLSQLPDDTRIDAIVNLAGEPLANGLWTVGKRHRILASRLRMTGNVVRLIRRLERKPSVLVSASAIGWYGLQGDETLTERADGRPCFTRQVCADWERAAVQAERFGVRVVRLRIGLVLGTEGGLLASLLSPFEYGLGGPIGSGTQWMSWIARDDLVRLIAHAIATPSLAGVVNATAPEPVRNAAFARELGRALHRPAVLRLPAAPLRLVAGDLAEELLLGGQRVVPEKALKSGFVFRHPGLRGALAAILGGGPAGGDRSRRMALPGVSMPAAEKTP